MLKFVCGTEAIVAAATVGLGLIMALFDDKLGFIWGECCCLPPGLCAGKAEKGDEGSLVVLLN